MKKWSLTSDIIVPLVISSREELIRMWSMREEEFPAILVALVIHWMKPFSLIVEKYFRWLGFWGRIRELMLESRQI